MTSGVCWASRDRVMELAHYQLETLHQDGEFILYRGRCQTTETSPPSLLALSPVLEHPAPATLRKIAQEFSFKDELGAAWAVRPIALTQHQSRTVLLFEDPGGEPLHRLVRRPLEMKPFLHCAIGLAAALRQLHGRGLIHKEIKPSNVLANVALDHAWLRGFGIASRLPREHQRAETPESITGTFAYMAPEQTGRMNRSIDSRSDLYALGIVLYELVTGSLPFTASDPMEWIHCHIARQPLAPAVRRRGVPRPVSAIVMKLLAKTAENRYQTSAGLERDLRRCLAQFEAEGRVDEFALGEHDTPDRLLIPEKLYGREREIDILLAAFDRIVKGGAPELVLVSGYAGIGKSSVVNELHRVLVPPRGLFAAGKFDQYKRDIPYSTLAHAFQDLVRPLLGKSEGELARWRDALRDALGPNGQLMVDLVPEVKLIIGDQPPVPELPPQDAQRRFQLVFRRFLSVFARPAHPLALFLDDLQWLDAATHDLLEDLLTQPDLRHVLLIGAYRDNEVTSTHQLIRTLDTIRRAGARVEEIRLAPLTGEDVAQLIVDSLYCDRARAASLAQLMIEKTDGNPFFVIQFLAAMVEEGLLTFDHGDGLWSWDLTRIHAKGYTDNVVDLMVGKLSRLPIATQSVLRQFACLGNSAERALLGMVCESSQERLDSDLDEALRAGLVLLAGNSYRFLHDRVQEAAYSPIPESQRVETHLRIGRLLAAHTQTDKLEETIFEIVNQLNRGAALMTSRDEMERLAQFNLIAGTRAKASTAYVSALNYLVGGTVLLGDDGWERRPDLMLPLELNRAECELLTSDFAAAEERLAMLMSRTVSSIDQAAIACLRIDLYMMLDRNDRAVDVCLAYMHHLGIDWSSRPTDEEARRAYDRTWSRLGGRGIHTLIDLPLMKDPAVVATLDVLTKALTPALYTDANVLTLIACQMITLSLEHGNSDGSCLGYVWMGRVAGYRFGNYEAGFQFGQLGYDLVERSGLERFRARTYISFGNFCMAWGKHVRAGRGMIRRAFDAASANGDLTHGAFSGNNLIANLLASGDPLADVQREAERGLAFARRARFGAVIDLITTQLAFIRTLRGLTTTFGSLTDAPFDEVQFERSLSSGPAEGAPISACRYWIRKMQARFLAGDYAAAVDAALHVQHLLWTTPPVIDVADGHLYAALSHAASCDPMFPVQNREHIEALAVHHKQLVEWAENCPENFEHRAALVGAEIARLEGRELAAERLYEMAIRSARDNDFVQSEAVANEVAARFYAARGFETIAQTYLRNARACYAAWGADGKVTQLDRLYPGLHQHQSLPGPTATFAATVEGLDLATVIRVSQAVSSEIVQDKLLDTVMRTAMEHAGADRALLFLPHGDQLHIKAEAMTDGTSVVVQTVNDGNSTAAAPESLLRYVVRTHDQIIVDDAAVPDSFATDDYFREMPARSAACLPLLKQGTLVGVLYLENTLASHVFTPVRLELLEVLASQAAIALENTRLYRDLEQREAKIRRLVDANILGVCIWTLEGALVEANEAFLRMVDYGRDDLVSGRLSWNDLTPVEWRESDERALTELRASGTVQPYEKEVVRRDGIRVPVLVGAAVFEEGGQDGVAFVLDLSGQKHAEAELVNERTRIARELHDTLLQSFHGLMFRFQAAANVLPDRPSEAKQRLEVALKQGTHAIREGRDAIQGLRSSATVTNDLAVALSTLGEELATMAINEGQTRAAALDVTIHGTPRTLSPIVLDDIHRIGSEALRNAFRHARAGRIEVEIRYDDRHFQLRVRDDGQGIDAAVLNGHQAGHFGLPGMRERAELIGGQVEVWSETGMGTEVALVIPAAAAYATSLPRRHFWPFRGRTQS